MVDPSMTIADLKQFVPDPGYIFMADGIVMVEGVPLKSYSLKDGSYIVAIMQQATNVQEQWSQLMRDRDAFENRMASIANPQLTRDIGRLRDLRLMRLERRPDFLPRLSSYFAEMSERTPRKFETVVCPRAQKPSTEAIPIRWEESVMGETAVPWREPPSVPRRKQRSKST
jgi:hypothetical protein